MTPHSAERIAAWTAVILAPLLVVAWFAIAACSTIPASQDARGAAQVIHGTLGGLHAACAAVDVPDATWRHICDAVDKALPVLDQLGAGPAELPPDVAARPVMLVIGAE